MTTATDLLPLDQLDLPLAKHASALPLWMQVAQHLRIAISQWRPGEGTRLLPEADLAKTFGVSTATIRQALSTLEGEGLVSRRRRLGTFALVEKRSSAPLHLIGALDAMLEQQESESITLLDRTTFERPAFLDDAFPASESITRIRRLRLEAGEPSSFAINYLPAEVAARLSDDDLQSAPMSRLIHYVLGIPLSRFDNELQSVAADADVANVLDIEPLSPVLLSENKTFDERGNIADVASIYYRGDRFKYSVSVNLA